MRRSWICVLLASRTLQPCARVQTNSKLTAVYPVIVSRVTLLGSKAGYIRTTCQLNGPLRCPHGGCCHHQTPSTVLRAAQLSVCSSNYHLQFAEQYLGCTCSFKRMKNQLLRGGLEARSNAQKTEEQLCRYLVWMHPINTTLWLTVSTLLSLHSGPRATGSLSSVTYSQKRWPEENQTGPRFLHFAIRLTVWYVL